MSNFGQNVFRGIESKVRDKIFYYNDNGSYESYIEIIIDYMYHGKFTNPKNPYGMRMKLSLSDVIGKISSIQNNNFPFSPEFAVKNFKYSYIDWDLVKDEISNHQTFYLFQENNTFSYENYYYLVKLTNDCRRKKIIQMAGNYIEESQQTFEEIFFRKEKAIRKYHALYCQRQERYEKIAFNKNQLVVNENLKSYVIALEKKCHQLKADIYLLTNNRTNKTNEIVKKDNIDMIEMSFRNHILDDEKEYFKLIMKNHQLVIDEYIKKLLNIVHSFGNTGHYEMSDLDNNDSLSQKSNVTSCLTLAGKV